MLKEALLIRHALHENNNHLLWGLRTWPWAFISRRKTIRERSAEQWDIRRTRLTSERVHLSATLNYSCYTMFTLLWRHKENRPGGEEEEEIQKTITALTKLPNTLHLQHIWAFLLIHTLETNANAINTTQELRKDWRSGGPMHWINCVGI